MRNSFGGLSSTSLTLLILIILAFNGACGGGNLGEPSEQDAAATVDASTSDALLDATQSDARPLPDASDERCGVLTATIRDFPRSHPDFESFSGDRVATGIVGQRLGDDDKPTYACATPCRNSGGQVQVTSAATFAEWYNDIPGTNQSFEYEFELLPEGSGRYVFESSAFFPIDGLGFGDEGSRDMMGGLHNFHFTTEIHTRFQYRGGESFTFVGDDDLWLFINGRLAIDLGGLHARETASVNLDAQAAELGITPGETYTMDIFHAERHTFDSNFRIETSIECFELI